MDDYPAGHNAEIGGTRARALGFWAICVALVIAVLAYGSVDLWALGLLCIFAMLLVAAIVWDSLAEGELRMGMEPLQLPIIGLILIGLTQMLPLHSPNISSGLLPIGAKSSLSMDRNATGYFIALLMAYLVFFASLLKYLKEKKRVRQLSAIMVGFGGLMAFFAIIQRMADIEGIYGLRQTSEAIVFGSFINQHHFAAFMEMAFAVAMGFLLGRPAKKEIRFLLAFALAIMLIALLFTGSRGGLLGLLGLLAFLAFGHYLLGRRKHDEVFFQARFSLFAGLSFFGILTLAGALFLGAGSSLLRGLGLSAAASGGDPTGGRLHFWQVAVNIFWDNPIIGAGLDSFGVAFTKYDTWNGNFRIEQAHNDYLQALADGGVLGFACIAAFLFLLFSRGIKNMAAESDSSRRSIMLGALAGCFGIAIHSFFDFPLRTPSNALFFLSLCAIASTTIRGIHKKRRG